VLSLLAEWPLLAGAELNDAGVEDALEAAAEVEGDGATLEVGG